MTSIDLGQDFPVIVDFAHTPDSFKKLFKDVRPLVKGQIIAMFGSPGRRDKIKRAVQGQIAAKYADILVITEDDERDEGFTILEQIAKGAMKEGKKVGRDIFLVHNREKAIERSLRLAKNKDDMVLLLGKGHEKMIYRADGEHPWDEIGIAKKKLKKILAEKKNKQTAKTTQKAVR